MATVFTIGHSTRALEEFILILKAFHIELLCDIRTIPKSRRNPQFAGDALKSSLAFHNIEYLHLSALGGLRQPRKDSPNTGWKNDSFRGYADYMETQAFTSALEQLISLAATKRLVIMCAEAVPWRCHRSLVGDALLVRRIDVEDITSKTRAQAHKLTPWAKVIGERIYYPAPDPANDLFPES
jgi:uncharacterized protein (DUF488 family)